MKIKLFSLLCMLYILPLKAQYVLYWSDEFESTNLDQSKWVFDLGGGGWGNNESQFYTSNAGNIKVENGMLNITAKQEQIGSYPYTSSRITTKNLFAHKFGKVEARMKLPLGQGLWPAFWMLGSNISSVGWPQCGEIDIMEHVSNDPEVHGTIHWNNNGHAYWGDGTTCAVDQFHTYGIEWDATSIKWFLDGNQFLVANIQNGINNTEEFQFPFYLLLNLAVGGDWPGYPNGSTVFPAEMYVDYVRFYVDQAQADLHEKQISSLKFGPNPTQDEFKISFPTNESKNIKLNLFSSNGVLVSKQQLVCEEKLSLDARNLQSGIYFIEVNGGGMINERIKFVKE